MVINQLTLINYYLFINSNAITDYIQIIYELTNFYNVLGVVSHTSVSDGNRTCDPHANSKKKESVFNEFVSCVNLFFLSRRGLVGSVLAY